MPRLSPVLILFDRQLVLKRRLAYLLHPPCFFFSLQSEVSCPYSSSSHLHLSAAEWSRCLLYIYYPHFFLSFIQSFKQSKPRRNLVFGSVASLSMDDSSLEARYVELCKRHKVLPNSSVLSSLSKAEYQKSHHRQFCLVLFLDHLKGADFLPLIDLMEGISPDENNWIDILHESPCIVNEEYLMSLMLAANKVLRAVNLQYLSFTSGFLRNLLQGGLPCQILMLNAPQLQKLDMCGRFMRVHTLNLDFCTSLTSLHKDCFSCMPNLMHLSMCETRIVDLWTTRAALSKLPKLMQLRFQNCSCCEDTGPCPAYSNVVVDSSALDRSSFNPLKGSFKSELASTGGLDDSLRDSALPNGAKEPVGDSLESIFHSLKSLSVLDLSSKVSLAPDGHATLNNKASRDVCCLPVGNDLSMNANTQGSKDTSVVQKKYISHHPSLICFKKYYRDFMIASLTRLEVLDNLPIGKMERQLAKTVFSMHYEYLPYRRWYKESVVSILHNRGTGCHLLATRKSIHRKDKYYYSRSLCAAKLGSSLWPFMEPISNVSCILKGGIKNLRPRQFEYHPSDSSLMAFGTLDGEVVVINHENGKIAAYMPDLGATNRVLGLCWLKKYPSKVLAGSDSGLLRLFDIRRTPPKTADPFCSSGISFDNFQHLTSVHVNSEDEQFIVSGYTRNVALYDMGSGKCLQIFTDLHREPINVAKFAHKSPFVFATSSFDKDIKLWDLRQKMVQPCYTATSLRGNIMACFSPNDQYLLVSAVDNEVKQLLAVDGRLHTNFEVPSSGNPHNYTRSYYMNENDYIISGSSEEHVVRICCAQTGRRLKDVYLEGSGTRKAMFVQSLRSDPFMPFNMSILAAYAQSSSKCEIIKVNLLSSNECRKGRASGERFHLSCSLGG